MCVCIYTQFIIQNIWIVNEFSSSQAIVYWEIFYKEIIKNVLKDWGIRLNLNTNAQNQTMN
jgi:hypothetical protein